MKMTIHTRHCAARYERYLFHYNWPRACITISSFTPEWQMGSLRDRGQRNSPKLLEEKVWNLHITVRTQAAYARATLRCSFKHKESSISTSSSLSWPIIRLFHKKKRFSQVAHDVETITCKHLRILCQHWSFYNKPDHVTYLRLALQWISYYHVAKKKSCTGPRGDR